MPSAKATRNPDLAVIGAGIVGLWTALRAAQQGLSVTLIEKRGIGGGASGGPMGALMPHQPVNWSVKKQFQLDGLLSLPAAIAEVEDMTGLSAGYRRCGRWMPVGAERKRPFADQWAAASQSNWPGPFRWEVIDHTPDPGWLPQTAMPFGCNADNLSARVSPRALVAALASALELSGVEVRTNVAVEEIGKNGKLILSDDGCISAGATVLAAGWESFGLLATTHPQSLGSAVKGQAALLRPVHSVDPDLPILYDDGVYVIAHENGLVAVGSTSEASFGEPLATDGRLEALIDRAKALCPALDDAEVVEKWAGLRPKAEGRDPLVGPLPGSPGIFLATGGFKISFAIAHLFAQSLVDQITGRLGIALPKAFMPENRLARPGKAGQGT